MVPYFKLICGKIKTLPWLRAVIFDKVQFSISLQLISYENEGNILIWTTEQTGTERPYIKIWKQCTQLYKIIKITEETDILLEGPIRVSLYSKDRNKESELRTAK